MPPEKTCHQPCSPLRSRARQTAPPCGKTGKGPLQGRRAHECSVPVHNENSEQNEVYLKADSSTTNPAPTPWAWTLPRRTASYLRPSPRTCTYVCRLNRTRWQRPSPASQRRSRARQSLNGLPRGRSSGPPSADCARATYKTWVMSARCCFQGWRGRGAGFS